MNKQAMKTIVARGIRCILFDLGRTLWTPHDEAIVAMANRASDLEAIDKLLHYGCITALTREDAILLGTRIRMAVKERIRRARFQDPTYQPNFAEITMQELQRLGIPHVDPMVGKAIHDALRTSVITTRQLFDDALPTLVTLKQRGYLLGIVSNRDWGGDTFVEEICKMGLLEVFKPEYIVISADIGIRKPNPAIFQHILERIHIEPEETAMVGDALETDIRGAKALDLFAIWKPNPVLRVAVRDRWKTRAIPDSMPPQQRAEGIDVHAVSVMPALTPTESPLPDTFESEEEYLLNYEWNLKPRPSCTSDRVNPDLVIEYLHDLLLYFQGSM